MNMLKQLQGKDKCHLNLFSDDTYTNDVSFATLNELTTNSQRIVVFPYRFPQQVYQEKTFNSQMIYQDCFTDPFSWFALEGQQKHSCEELISSLDEVSDIFIDDLLLFGRSYQCIDNCGKWTRLIEFLLDLSKKHYVYVFFNPDLISDGDLRSLSYISQLYVDINSYPKIQRSFLCSSLLRRNSGKVFATKRVFMWDEKGNLILNKDISNDVETKELTDEVDPAANLTFNLRLTDTEKEARANTALPYLLNDSSKKAYLSNTGVKTSHIVIENDDEGGGEVMYMPDEVDDFDDEDPDDDLDF